MFNWGKIQAPVRKCCRLKIPQSESNRDKTSLYFFVFLFTIHAYKIVLKKISAFKEKQPI